MCMCMYRYNLNTLLPPPPPPYITADLDGEYINKCIHINTFLFDLYLIQSIYTSVK